MPATWMRTTARVVIFGGWVLPVLLARLMPGDDPRTREAARLFDLIGGGWAALAVVYAVVVAVRLRRDLTE